MAGLNTLAVLNAITSHALATGMFDTVNTHEPKSVPGRGVTCAIWMDEIRPAPGQSGLAATTARAQWMCRLYTSMLADQPDLIDPNMQIAADVMFTRLAEDFTLGGAVRNIDLLGTAGMEPLRAQAGYVNQDGKLLRVINIFVPVVINDCWSQSA